MRILPERPSSCAQPSLSAASSTTSFSKAMNFLLLYVLCQILLELVSPLPFFSEPYHEVQAIASSRFFILMPYYILSLKILLAKIQIITDYVTHSICIYIYALLNVLHYLYYHGLLNEISRNHDIYHGLLNEISPVRLFFKQGYEFSASLRTLANSS